MERIKREEKKEKDGREKLKLKDVKERVDI